MGLTGGSSIRGQQVTLLGVFVFPVALAAMMSVWVRGEWEALSGHMEGDVATQ